MALDLIIAFIINIVPFPFIIKKKIINNNLFFCHIDIFHLHLLYDVRRLGV